MNELLYQVPQGKLNFSDDAEISKNKDFAYQLQSRLRDFWLLDSPDGNWGPRSSKALARFKSFRSLTESGCGKLTASELINVKPSDLLRGFRLSGNQASLLTLYYTIFRYISNLSTELKS